MFWADEIVKEVEKAFPREKHLIVRDEKTASGRVHVGSLRGVVIHGVTALALAERGHKVTYYYEINDADPMDGLPVYLDREKFLPHMGKPLKDVPSPGTPEEAATDKKNYARYFGDEFVSVIRRLGFDPEIYFPSKFYKEGKFDKWIDIVLERAADIRRIYKEISGSEKEEDWNPVQVVCEKCGRVGTTTVTSWSGKRGEKVVEYVCERDKVKWAEGCGHRGKTVPYSGRGKLPWKVEWAAKWQIFSVHVEGAGKDHYAAGGSRHVAAEIAKQVFEGIVPVNIPYEFFTFSGAKMSASKGIGASSKEVADTLPEELLRFLMVRNRPERTIDFNPSGNTMPRLFDFYDEAAAIHYGHQESDIAEDIKRAFHFSQLKPGSQEDFFHPRFSRIAFLVQMPQLDFLEEVARLKGGKLNAQEKREAQRRADYAKIWLKKFAPENAKFVVQETVPELTKTLSQDQRKFLQDVADLLESKVWEGEELHAAIHDLRKKSPLTPQAAFQAIYIVLLGEDSGPQAGWFLDALKKDFVVKRFREI